MRNVFNSIRLAGLYSQDRGTYCLLRRPAHAERLRFLVLFPKIKDNAVGALGAAWDRSPGLVRACFDQLCPQAEIVFEIYRRVPNIIFITLHLHFMHKCVNKTLFSFPKLAYFLYIKEDLVKYNE